MEEGDVGEMGWRDAVIAVLEEEQAPMHYVDIAQAISDRALRTEVGATPAISVNVTVNNSLKTDGAESPFVRVSRGIYALRDSTSRDSIPADDEAMDTSTIDGTGLINAFGMYWLRDNVLWTTTPRILGRQQAEAKQVDFCGQRGVYLLHDGRSVVYVGRATDQPLGVRLRQHLGDRLNGRWNRFSWFGTHGVDEAGALYPPLTNCTEELLIVTMEAVLIEGLEPPQNRKRGDDFRAVEFLQVEDPEIRKRHIVELMDELKSKL